VRPFGLWQPVRAQCSITPQIASLPLVLINVVAGIIALVSSFMSVFFLIGHYFDYFGTAIGIVLSCAIILYHSWYRKLPTMCPD